MDKKTLIARMEELRMRHPNPVDFANQCLPLYAKAPHKVALIIMLELSAENDAYHEDPERFIAQCESELKAIRARYGAGQEVYLA